MDPKDVQKPQTLDQLFTAEELEIMIRVQAEMRAEDEYHQLMHRIMRK